MKELLRVLAHILFVPAFFIAFGVIIPEAIRDYQKQEARRGQVVVSSDAATSWLDPGPIYVDLKNRRVIDKSSVFPVITWEDKNGTVMVRHDKIAFRAYVIATFPANPEEVALFRKYFPRIST